MTTMKSPGVISISIFCLFLGFVSSSCNFDRDGDEFRTTCQLIKSRGFLCEVHTVITEDGYFLTIHRIVHPNASTAHLEPVILNHGLLASSSCWLIASPGGHVKPIGSQTFNSPEANNLGFVLAIQGWDVWLPNNRGTLYSFNHTHLDPKSGYFWRFSFDELIKYDTPTVIDYILKTTGHSTLAYVGHSQGTTNMFGLLSTQPKYNSIVKPFVALAPIAFVDNLAAPFRVLAEIPNLPALLSAYHGPIGNDHALVQLINRIACPTLDATCASAFFIIGGFDPGHTLTGRIYVYTSQTDLSSLQNFLHFAQNINDKNFEYYNSREQEVLSLTGFFTEFSPVSFLKSKPQAKVYPLEEITSTDMHLITGCNDLLGVPVDVDRLYGTLKVKPKTYCKLQSVTWTHLDHLWACDVWKENALVFDILERHRTGQWTSSLGFANEMEEKAFLCRESCPKTDTVSNLVGPATPKVVDSLNDIVGGLGAGILESLNPMTVSSALKAILAELSPN